MQEYKLITGDKETIEKEITEALNNGWELKDLTSTTIGSVAKYTQAITRTVETLAIVEPSTADAKLKRVKKAQ